MTSTAIPLHRVADTQASRRSDREQRYGDANLGDDLDEDQPLNTAYNSNDKEVRTRGLRSRSAGRQRRKENGYSDDYSPSGITKPKSRIKNICLYILLGMGVLSAVSGIVLYGPCMLRQETEDWLPHWGEPGNVGERLAHYPTDFTRDITPIPCHSHNDYWRRIPLFEAIHYGLTSVEADVWLQDDSELLVGHDPSSLARNRTFTSLYVNPIRELLDHQNPDNEFAHGTKNGIFDTDREQTLILLVDIKTDGYETLPAVQKHLEALRSQGYLTYFDGKTVVRGAVQVVMTGNTPFDLLVSNTTYRDVFFDAPLDKIWEDSEERSKALRAGVVRSEDGLSQYPRSKRADIAPGQGMTGVGSITGASFTPENSYYASVSLRKVLGWSPQFGGLDEKQRAILRSQIKAAQAQSLKVRYWDTPNWPVGLRNRIWETLLEEGVDYLNVDDLKGVSKGDWGKGKWRLW